MLTRTKTESSGQELLGQDHRDDFLDDSSVGEEKRAFDDEVVKAKRQTFLKCCLINIGVVVALLVIAIAVVATQLKPLCQDMITSATIVLSNVTMFNPTFESIMMNASFNINNAGPFPATVDSFDCLMYNDEGTLFAKMVMPPLTVAASAPSPVALNQRVEILNLTVFTLAAAKLLQGIPSTWSIRGNSTVRPTILGMTMDMPGIEITSNLPLPATLLKGVETSNTQIVAGDGNSLICTADTRFFSSSVLSISHLGPTTFKLYTTGADGTMSNVSVGLATMQDFNVGKGVNYLEGAHINITKTPENLPEVQRLLSTWARGLDQTIYLSGPIASGILDGVVVQTVTMKGVTQNLITSSLIEKYHSYTGHNTVTGEPCGLTTPKGECIRGAIMIMKNPNNFTIQMKNAMFNVDWQTPMRYNVTVSAAAGIVKVHKHCPLAPQKISLMYTAKGMYSYVNKAYADVDTITLPAGATTSSFIAGTFQPGQVDPNGASDLCSALAPGYDCCFATKFAAAACRSVARGLNYIPAYTEGNATLVADTFEVNLTMGQDNLPIFFANDIPNMDIDTTKVSCSDFTFFD